MRLAGRTAIITGAGSGIGRASAVLFAKEGAYVALVDRDRAGLQETLTAIDGVKGEASVHVGDVSEADFAPTAVGDIMTRRARLDVLMTAAGFSCGGTVLTTDPADWDAVFRTNVGGTWLWSRGGSGRGRASSRQRCIFLYDGHRDGGRWRLARGMNNALVALEAQVRADLAKTAHPGAAWLAPKQAPDERPALDVLVVGAGQSGLAPDVGR